MKIEAEEINIEMINTHEAQEGGKNRNLGNSVPWQHPNTATDSFHALCLRHRGAMKEAGEVNQGTVWPQWYLEPDNRKERTPSISQGKEGKVVT